MQERIEILATISPHKEPESSPSYCCLTTHAAALEAFGRLSNPATLAPKLERLLAFLETEYEGI